MRRCNKSKQDSTSEELRIIAKFMDVWGDEVDSDINLNKSNDTIFSKEI